MSGRIVVVEDEQLTRTILIDALQQAGFSVREFTLQRKSISQVSEESHCGHFAVAFVDDGR